MADTRRQPTPEFLQRCVLCQGRVESFRGPNDHTMGTCTDCGMSFVVPDTAWEVARLTNPPKPARKIG